MQVLYFEEWQGVRPAKRNPREAKNDTASSHHCLQQMPEPGADHSKYFTNLKQQMLCLTPITFTSFLPVRHTDRVFHCPSNDRLTRLLDKTFLSALLHSCGGMSAAEQQLLK